MQRDWQLHVMTDNASYGDLVQTTPDRATAQPASIPKLPSLDVLRGLAALGIGWFHARVDLWVGFKAIQSDPSSFSLTDRLLSYLSLPASQLGGTVMLFFVLSGFCIHLPIASRQRAPHWPSYAIRRFLRLYPAYLATLLLCLMAALLFFQAADEPGELSAYASSALLLQNWLQGGRQVAMNPSLWTIPVEVEAYLFYPLLYWLWRRKGVMATVVYTFVCTLIGFLLFAHGFGQASTSFFKYALIWNAGAWLAEAYVNHQLPPWTRLYALGVGSLPVLTMLGGLAGIDTFYLHYCWGLWAVLLLLWVLGPGARLFDVGCWWVPPLMLVGTVSYSYYLLHFPVFKLAGAFWLDFYSTKPESFLWPTLGTVTMIPIAWCFYVVVERPTHHLARRLGSSLAQ